MTVSILRSPKSRLAPFGGNKRRYNAVKKQLEWVYIYCGRVIGSALLLFCWLRPLHDSLVRTFAAEIVFPQLRIFIFAQNNDGRALGAFCRLISRRIG